jgi:hypothetical protein
MSKTNGELMACLKELGLPTARGCCAELADSARREQLSYEGYLLEVLQRECQGRHRIDYRHVIDWLVRKPGAFADYRYQADLFPSTVFRVAYDRLKRQYAASADKQYLKILELAARESQALVEAAIGRLCERDQAMSFEAVEALVLGGQESAVPTAVRVDQVDLSVYDRLLDGQAARMVPGAGVGHE